MAGFNHSVELWKLFRRTKKQSLFLFCILLSGKGSPMPKPRPRPAPRPRTKPSNSLTPADSLPALSHVDELKSMDPSRDMVNSRIAPATCNTAPPANRISSPPPSLDEDLYDEPEMPLRSGN